MIIKTYPGMNAKIVEILRSYGDPVLLYAAQRIEELETATAHLERLDAASQRALALAMRENRVRDECLKIAVEALKAIKVLKWNVATRWLKIHAASALDEIEQHLAELEPEEEAE